MQLTIFFFKTSLILLLSWLLGFIFPWWGFVVGAAIGGALLHQGIFMNFLSGFLGCGLFYLISGYWAGTEDNFTFAHKVAAIFGEGMGAELSGYTLLWAGSILYALLGALAATGAALVFSKDQIIRLQDKRHSKTKRLKLDL
jgi:hypothetical protein